MATLLHIDSSPLIETSVSRTLSRHFVSKWKAGHPDGTVIVRDLSSTEIPPVSAAWVAATYVSEAARTPEQVAALKLSETLIAELEAADEYVLGVAMHNFSVPAVLKLWIDQIVRAGRTFTYVGGARKGLLQSKKITCLAASGGNYDAGMALESADFVKPYLRTVFAFVGVTDVTFITAGGTAALRRGADRQALIAPHLDAIERCALVNPSTLSEIPR